MELIFLLYRLVYWLIVAPVWWISDYLASYFYPYEGDTGYMVLSVILSAIILVGMLYGFILLF